MRGAFSIDESKFYLVGDAGLEPTAFGSGDSSKESDTIREKLKK